MEVQFVTIKAVFAGSEAAVKAYVEKLLNSAGPVTVPIELSIGTMNSAIFTPEYINQMQEKV